MSQRKAGALLSYLSIAVKILITFIVTPFLLNSLGSSQYGIFSIVGSLAAYLAILDFGVNDSTIRYLVRCKKIENKEEVRNILSSISILYLCIGAAIVATGIILYFNLELIFSKPFTAEEMQILKAVFIISFISITINIVFNPVTALMVAHERFIILKSMDILVFTLTNIFIVIFLVQGYKIVAVVIVAAVINLSSIAFKTWYVRHILKVKFYMRWSSGNYIKELFIYAAPIFIVVLVEQIYWKLDNIIIGAILGPSFVAVYAVGVAFQKYLLSFSTSISRVFIPKIISQTEDDNTGKVINQSLIDASRYQAIIVLLIILGLIFFGKEFIELWLGKNYTVAYYVMICVLVPMSIEMVGNLRNTIMQVKKIYFFRSVLILIISLFNAAGTIIFVPIYGIVSAAFFYRVRYYIRIYWGEFYNAF